MDANNNSKVHVAGQGKVSVCEATIRGSLLYGCCNFAPPRSL